MKASARFIVGLGLGFTLGMLACWTSPGFVFQRIGMGLVMLAGLAAFAFAAGFVIDSYLRLFKLTRLFVAFMWERRDRTKRKHEPSDDD